MRRKEHSIRKEVIDRDSELKTLREKADEVTKFLQEKESLKLELDETKERLKKEKRERIQESNDKDRERNEEVKKMKESNLKKLKKNSLQPSWSTNPFILSSSSTRTIR